MNPVDSVVDIRDPEIDVDALKRTLHDRLQARQAQARAQGQDYRHLVDDPVQPRESGAAVVNLIETIQMLRELGDNLRQIPTVTDWRVPLANGLINWLKRPFHALAVMYVNNLAIKQVVVNRQVRWALMSIAETQLMDAERIAALEQEVEHLRERLAARASSDR